jgi:hypothetical protein
MKNKVNQGWWSLVKAGLAVILFLGAVQAVQAADKGTAANTQMTNTASATYYSGQDVGFLTQLNADSNLVSITINLVEAAPAFSYKDATTLANDGSPVNINELTLGQTVFLNYTITSQTNGPDEYSLIYNAESEVNIDVYTTTLPDVDLGASSVATATDLVAGCVGAPSAGTDCTIALPNDGAYALTTGPNGFETGDTVVFETGQVCTVGLIVVDTNGASDVGDTLSSIDVMNCDAIGATITKNTTVYERAVISIEVVVTSLDATDPPFGTLTIDVDAEPTGTTGLEAGPLGPQDLIAYFIDLQIHKFVRETTTSPTCALTALSCLTIGGNTYSKVGVSADPFESLEYAILAFNRGGPVANVIVTDAIINFTARTGNIDLIPLGTAANDNTGSCLDVGVGVSTAGTCTVAGTIVTNVDAAATASISGVGTEPGDVITVSAGHATGAATTEPLATGGELGVGEVSVVLFTVLIN